MSWISAYPQVENKVFNNKVRKQYETFQKQSNTKYANLRQKANLQYAEFMRKGWEQFHASPAIPVPPSPDPVVPPIMQNPDEKPTDNPVPQGDIVPLPAPI